MRKRALCAALIATLAVPAITLPMGSRPDDSRTYYFDGSSFREDRTAGFPAIVTRIGRLPRLFQHGADADAAPLLPPGTGALAGICYIQQSGGKLGSRHAFRPRPGMTITVRGTGLERETRCDGEGFFSVALPPGRYEVAVGTDAKSVAVEQDKTTLVSLRGGKRMVD